MVMLPFISLLFYITIIVCKSSASCPCHIPCTGEKETCTCYGPCGDDGYGCKINGEDYDFLNEIMCQENEWIVQCIRQASCSSNNTLDDTNLYAANQLETQKNNILQHSFDDINEDNTASFSWFGGNWFDFWGQNDVNLFNDNDQEYHSLLSQSHSTHRTLQNSPSMFASKLIMDDLGRNKAGYKIIALPLYILIVYIISSSILGMLMCAGIVYCSLHYCSLFQTPSRLESLTLNSGYNLYKSSDNDYNNYNIYHNMSNALHSPTTDETSSLDEYNDSEDDNNDKINNNNITPRNIEHDNYDFKWDNKTIS